MGNQTSQEYIDLQSDLEKLLEAHFRIQNLPEFKDYPDLELKFKSVYEDLCQFRKCSELMDSYKFTLAYSKIQNTYYEKTNNVTEDIEKLKVKDSNVYKSIINYWTNNIGKYHQLPEKFRIKKLDDIKKYEGIKTTIWFSAGLLVLGGLLLKR